MGLIFKMVSFDGALMTPLLYSRAVLFELFFKKGLKDLVFSSDAVLEKYLSFVNIY